MRFNITLFNDLKSFVNKEKLGRIRSLKLPFIRITWIKTKKGKEVIGMDKKRTGIYKKYEYK